MKQICVLLNGGVCNDSRVIKTINYLSQNWHVNLFYTKRKTDDCTLFNNNVKLNNVVYPKDFKHILIKHSLFYLEYLFLSDAAIKSKIKFDFVWANDLPCLKPAYIIKKNTGAKLIYDSHEIYVETLNQFFSKKSGVVKSLIFRAIIKFMRFVGRNEEKKLLKKADYFITVGNELKKYFEKQYSYQGIRVIMNCPDVNKLSDTVDLKSSLGINQSSKLVIYQGVLNYGRGLHLMIEAFKHVNENVFLLILGSGMIKQELVDLVMKNQLENKVFFHAKVDLSELHNYTAAADFGINLLEDINLSKKYAVPNKLFEYIHAGLPVISSKMPESVAVYKEFCIGKLVENDPHKIAEAINNITMEDITDYRKNCKLAKNKYNWENQVKVLNEIFS